MKGVILAGGSGTRLYPATIAINKHFIPVYNKPMIYYPLSILMLAGIREILLVVNPQDRGAFECLLGDGEKLGLKLTYRIQEAPRGLAHGLSLAEDFAAGEAVCLILGDNIFFGHGLPELLREAKEGVEKEGGAFLFAYYVPDPERYGVVEFDAEGRVVSLEEKPASPRSNWAVVGLYFYDPKVFDYVKEIEPSDRGELEITSVNQKYLEAGRLRVKLFGRGFAWFDAGTHDSFLEAGEFVATIEKRTGLMIGCPEEIAYRQGWIDRKTLRGLAEPLAKTAYGKYLLRLAEGKDAFHL